VLIFYALNFVNHVLNGMTLLRKDEVELLGDEHGALVLLLLLKQVLLIIDGV